MNYEIDLSNIFTIYFKFNFRIKLFTNDGKKISDCVYFETSFIYVYYWNIIEHVDLLNIAEILLRGM